MSLLRAENIAVNREDGYLFKKINISLNNGEIVQVTGANGSGKTTLLKILAGLYRDYSGTVFWRNQLIHDDPQNYFKELFYLGHQNALKLELTAFENLALDPHYTFVNKNEIITAIDALGLNTKCNNLVSHLSHGQRQRLALAKLLVSKSSLIILDEPFNSLDIAAVDFLQEMLAQKTKSGAAIIFTSHQTLNFKNWVIRNLQLN